MALTDKLKAIGSAIRAKTGGTEELTLDQMVTEIEGIEGGSGGGVDVEQVEANFLADPSRMPFEELERLVRYKNSKVTTLRQSAFRGCISLVEVDFPNLTYTGGYAFAESYLERANLPKLVTCGNSEFGMCTYLIQVNVPMLNTVSYGMFSECEKLERIDLPTAVVIGNYAFANCTSLKTVIIRSETELCRIELDSFDNTPLMTGEGHIYVPSSVYESYRAGYEAALDQFMPGFFNILFRKIEDYPEICG